MAGGEWHVSLCHRQQMLRRVRGEGGEMRLATLEYSEYKLWAYLDSIAFSIFVDILVELKNTNVSEAKIQITLLEVRRGALSSFTHLSHKS